MAKLVDVLFIDESTIIGKDHKDGKDGGSKIPFQMACCHFYSDLSAHLSFPITYVNSYVNYM